MGEKKYNLQMYTDISITHFLKKCCLKKQKQKQCSTFKSSKGLHFFFNFKSIQTLKTLRKLCKS